jgi:hypothetical protein
MNLSIKEINELIYSLGITAHNGNFCNREVNESLLERLYCELNDKIAEEAIDEEVDEPEYDSAGFSIEDRYPHYVTNEEADEDAFTDHLLGADLDYIASVSQDEQRYEDTFVSDSARTLKRDRFNGASQFILDFVEASPSKTATFFEMNEAYRSFTGGSNSLSHIIKALMIPYKNRPTRRYLYKVKHGVYGVRVANPSNWVVSDYDYKTFNEAPYGE